MWVYIYMGVVGPEIRTLSGIPGPPMEQLYIDPKQGPHVQPTAPKVPPERATWPVFDGDWVVFRGCWGVGAKDEYQASGVSDILDKRTVATGEEPGPLRPFATRQSTLKLEFPKIRAPNMNLK